ncbi:hypothetical protein HanIR_Chr06g0285871 [Helianthus annuus]|nr:hypothetical protein HanIR_Chr06g0285871 [Helianthus annuus]
MPMSSLEMDPPNTFPNTPSPAAPDAIVEVSGSRKYLEVCLYLYTHRKVMENRSEYVQVYSYFNLPFLFSVF